MQALRQIAQSIDNVVLKVCPLWAGVPIVFGLLLYLRPSVFGAVLVIVVQTVLAIAIARIFLLEQNEFSHGQGIWFALAAILAVVVGFGAIYSALLLEKFPTEAHFRFAEGTKSLEAMNDIHGGVHIQVSKYLLEKGVQSVLGCTPDKKTSCEPRLPSWTDDEQKRIEFELSLIVYRLHGEPGLGFEQVKSLMASKALEHISSETHIEEAYLHAALALIGEHERATNFQIFDTTKAKNALELDYISQAMFPKQINSLIGQIIECAYGLTTEGCSKETKIKVAGIPNSDHPPFGALSLARMMFAQRISAALQSFELDTSELVFNSFLFSALSLVTQGHPDMVAISMTARLIWAAEILAFIIVLLLVIPVGLKQRPHT